MRWRWAAFGVVVLVVVGWTLRTTSLTSTSRMPAQVVAARTPEPKIDLLAAAKDFRKILSSSKFTLSSCSTLLSAAYKNIFELRVERLQPKKLKTESTEILQTLFETKLLLRAKLREFGAELNKKEDCVAASRNVLRAGRVLEDVVGEYALDYPDVEDEPDQPEVLSGKSPHLMINPAFSSAELKSGDVLLSRGSAFVSAAIARMTDETSNFSHAEIVYIDPESGKRWTIGAHIEVGALVQPLERYLADGKTRALIFRHPDQKLAQAAAELMYKKVKAYREENGENIPYDFHMNDGDASELYCSELVGLAFKEASNGKFKLPQFVSRLPSLKAKNRDFFDKLGIRTEQAFVPADIELDPRLDLVAEWRDFTRVHTSHLHDAVLSAMFEWMDRENYVLKETSLIGIKKLVAWHLRRWPVFSSALRNKLPSNMSQDVIGTMTALNEASEALFARIEAADDQRKEDTGFWMTPGELAKELEAYRREDLKVYQTYQKTSGYDPLARRPDFHLLFRPR